jgi:hypothetical protein
MRSPWLLLTPLAALPFVTSPAGAVDVLSSCCVIAPAEDIHGDPHEHGEPILAPAEISRRDERTLEAAAEVPVPAEAPLVNAIGIPLDAQRGVSEPERVRIVEPPPLRVDPNGPPTPAGLIPLPPCCRIVGEGHPPDPHEEGPPLLVGAKVRSPGERALETAVELPIPAKSPLVSAIGIPLDAQRGVSEPVYRPAIVGSHSTQPDVEGPPCCTRRSDERAPVDAPWRWLRTLEATAEVVVPVLLMLLAIGFRVLWRRRRPVRLEDQPTSPRRFPDELPLPDMAPIPVVEPEVALAKARRKGRELEPA